jgi:GLEYA domain
MSKNGISDLSTKQLKQVAKLDIAQAKRQGKIVAYDGSVSGSVDDTKNYYRVRNIYDITLLPTQYSGNDVLNNNNDRGLVEGRPWGFSLPIQLFAAGENGAWFDVNDIATLFQDSAGTIRVSAAGDPVGKILDKSGNDNHATQSTAGKRPVYRVDANGYAYLEFDGVNDFMSTSNINLTGTAQVTASVGLSVDSGNYVAGFTKTTYSGYHGEDPAFSDSGTITATTVTSTVNIPSESTTTTELYIGYILADYTGTWTFALTSDDGGYLWIGDNAISGYTTGNAFINNGGEHGSVTVSSSISLTAGQYYPIRLLSGNNGGPGTLNLTYAHTGRSATNDFTGIAVHNNPGVAICTGSNPNSVNGTFLIGAPSAIADHSFYLRGTTTIIARVPNEVTGDDILTGLFDISQSTKELELIPRLNGVVSTNIVWSGTDAGTGNFGNQPLYIGSLGGTGTFFKGKIYGVIVRGASSTASEISNIEAWVDGILN